ERAQGVGQVVVGHRIVRAQGRRDAEVLSRFLQLADLGQDQAAQLHGGGVARVELQHLVDHAPRGLELALLQRLGGAVQALADGGTRSAGHHRYWPPTSASHSSSVRTWMPRSVACFSLEPAPGPATTRSVFFDTEPATLAPRDS